MVKDLQPIYLDYAATSPVDQLVLQAMSPYYTTDFYNPSANYALAKKVHRDYEQARTTIAGLLGAKSSEIIFTAGASEANNLAINGVMKNFPTAKVLISAIEHDSVREVVKKYNYQEIPVDQTGNLDLKSLQQALKDDEVILISLIYANNEIGQISQLAQVGKLIKAARLDRQLRGHSLPIYLHSDGAQAANLLDISVNRLSVDLFTLNAHKIYGPKQVGLLFVKAGLTLNPQIVGGKQEFGLRAGTENVAGVIGFSLALSQARSRRLMELARLVDLRNFFMTSLREKIKNVQFNGYQSANLASILNVQFPNQDNEQLLFGLDEYGIMASAGSACSASNQEASHVLLAIGLTEAAARSSIRFSFGRQTTKDQLTRTVYCLNELLKS